MLCMFCYAFLRNDIFLICAWAMCCRRDSRATNKSPRICDSTISNIKGRAKKRSMSPGSFRVLSGEHQLLHISCLPRGPSDMQAQLRNSHSSSHASTGYSNGVFCLLCVGYGNYQRSRAFTMTPFMKPL